MTPRDPSEVAAKRLKTKARNLRAAKSEITVPEHCAIAVHDALDEAAAIIEDVASVCESEPVEVEG